LTTIRIIVLILNDHITLEFNDKQRPAVGQKTVSEVLEETIVDIDVLSRVTPEEVKRIMDEVLTEMLVGLSVG